MHSPFVGDNNDLTASKIFKSFKKICEEMSRLWEYFNCQKLEFKSFT